MKSTIKNILGLALAAGFTFAAAIPAAQAEYITGLKTWIGQDRNTMGMLHFDSRTTSRVGWTTNGSTYDCVQTSVDFPNQRKTVYCPSINYTFNISRFQVEIVSSGGSTFYPGQWDDRRFKFYQAGDINGSFTLRDGFKWEEVQFRNSVEIVRFNFIETSRDNDWVYMHDASRNISVALGKAGIYVAVAGGAWTKFYDGNW